MSYPGHPLHIIYLICYAGGAGMNKRAITHILIILIIISAAEVFIFNYKSFVGLTLSKVEYPIQNAVLNGFEYTGHDNIYKAVTDNPEVTFQNINHMIKIFYIDVQSSDKYTLLPLSVNYVDETGSKFSLYDPGIVGINKSFSVIADYEPTKYITCAYSGKTEALKFTFLIEKGSEARLNSLIINKNPPVRLSFVRIFILSAIAILFYCIKYVPEFKKPFCVHNIYHLFGIVFSTVLFMLLCICIHRLYTGGIFPGDFCSLSGDQVSKELPDAFMNHKVYLSDTPSDELLNLPNPYDYSQRKNIEFKWDHLLYDGKYYSYYGIAPVLLVFLPYRIITGYYFPTEALCLISSMAAAILLSMVYTEIIKRWFPDIPFCLALCGNITLLPASGILFCMVRPSFYENAESFGFMMFLAALLLILKSEIFNFDEKYSIKKLTAASLTMALAVMSRPTFALYAVAYFICISYFVCVRTKRLKKILCNCALIFLPMIILGIVQMLYNYLRFGSVFDFGISYSLTINDFTHSAIHMKTVFLSFWNFLFGIPVVTSTFPYIHGLKENFSLNGSYYTDTGNILGAFFRIPLLFSLFYVPAYLKNKKIFKSRHTACCAFFLLMSGIICPLITIGLTWESGHALRYNIDFASQMFLTALLVSFGVFRTVKNNTIKNYLTVIMAIASCITVITSVLVLFEYIPGVTRQLSHSGPYETILYYKIKSVISFWE